MRKKTFSILLFSAIMFTAYGNTHLGLVAQLIEIKNTSEFYLANILHDEDLNNDDKKKAIQDYNEIKLELDKILYQLTADMKRSGSIKLYKKLDNFYKTNDFSYTTNANKKIELYVEYINIVNKTFIANIKNPYDQKVKVDPAIILTAIELVWTVYSDIQKSRGAKVDGITEILNNVRLIPSIELAPKK